jgi:hypothetical protein
MAGYTPWMAGAKAHAEKLARIQKAKARAEQREAYNEYRAEARACGYEPCSFEVWSGEKTAREEAEDRMGSIPTYFLDLY